MARTYLPLRLRGPIGTAEPSAEIVVSTRPSASWVLDAVSTVVSSEDAAAAVAIPAMVLWLAIAVQSAWQWGSTRS